MTIELTRFGLEVETLEEVLDNIEESQRTNISPVLDQSSTSPLGQVNAIIANAITTNLETLSAIYSAMDPDTALGSSLDRLSAITGTTRRLGDAATVSASLTFTSLGPFEAGSLVARIPSNEEATFRNVHDITPGTAPSVMHDVLMRADITGSFNLVIGGDTDRDLSEIVSSVAGWSAISASQNYIKGTDPETDEELRSRRETELFLPGTTSVNGIRSQISSNVSGVISVTVLDNTGSVTSTDGIPPYALECIVFGSFENDDLATTLFDSVSAGTPTHGTTEVEILDDSDNTHVMRWTVPAVTGVNMLMDIKRSPGTTYPGNDFVRQTIVSRSLDVWVPGRDIFVTEIQCWAHEVPGVLSATITEINGITPATDLTVGIRQIATITAPASTNIGITASIVTP